MVKLKYMLPQSHDEARNNTVFRSLYWPFQLGWRFSTKALAPSFASSLASICINAGQVFERKAFKLSSKVRFSVRFTASLTAASERGAACSNSRASARERSRNGREKAHHAIAGIFPR